MMPVLSVLPILLTSLMFVSTKEFQELQRIAEEKDRITRYIDAFLPTDWENSTKNAKKYWKRKIERVRDLNELLIAMKKNASFIRSNYYG